MNVTAGSRISFSESVTGTVAQMRLRRAISSRATVSWEADVPVRRCVVDRSPATSSRRRFKTSSTPPGDILRIELDEDIDVGILGVVAG